MDLQLRIEKPYVFPQWGNCGVIAPLHQKWSHKCGPSKVYKTIGISVRVKKINT